MIYELIMTSVNWKSSAVVNNDVTKLIIFREPLGLVAMRVVYLMAMKATYPQRFTKGFVMVDNFVFLCAFEPLWLYMYFI
jgi:hypothetical protein